MLSQVESSAPKPGIEWGKAASHRDLTKRLQLSGVTYWRRASMIMDHNSGSIYQTSQRVNHMYGEMTALLAATQSGNLQFILEAPYHQPVSRVMSMFESNSWEQSHFRALDKLSIIYTSPL